MRLERRIGDFVDILSGFAFDSEYFGDSGSMPVVRIRDVVRGKSSTYYSGNVDERYVVHDGDLLIGMDGEFNRARWCGGEALLNQRVCRIKSSSRDLDEGYLFHMLPRALKRIEQATSFVTVKHLSVKQIREIAIPMPPVVEQRRIAEILDKADALRAKRRAALAQLDTLTQSIFLDMFGDPAANTRRWPLRLVSQYVDAFEGGKSIDAEPGDGVVTRNRVLKISAVTAMRFLAYESKPVPDSYDPPQEHFVRPGDLLFSRANTSELVGAVAYVDVTPPNVLLPDKLWRFVWSVTCPVEPLFVWALFQTRAVRHEIARRATGTSGSMKNISQGKLFGVRTIFPPLDLQRRFAERIAVIRRMGETATSSGRELDALFASLQHRAFRGEL